MYGLRAKADARSSGRVARYLYAFGAPLPGPDGLLVRSNFNPTRPRHAGQNQFTTPY
jgi:hypothetical protein